MRQEADSTGPQSWPEFQRRYRQLMGEEVNRGRKWDDLSEPEAEIGVVRGFKGNEDLSARERFSNFVGYERYSVLLGDWDIVLSIPDLKPWMKEALEFLRDNGNRITRETKGGFAWSIIWDADRYQLNDILYRFGFRVSPTGGGSGIYSLYRSRAA